MITYLITFTFFLTLFIATLISGRRFYFLHHYSFGWQFLALDFANRHPEINKVYWFCEGQRGNRYVSLLFENVDITCINLGYFHKLVSLIDAKWLMNQMSEMSGTGLICDLQMKSFKPIKSTNPKFKEFIITNDFSDYLSLLENGHKPRLPENLSLEVEERVGVSPLENIVIVHHRSSRSSQFSDKVRSTSTFDTIKLIEILAPDFDRVFLLSDEPIDFNHTKLLKSQDLCRNLKDIAVLYFQIKAKLFVGPHSGAILPSSSMGAKIIIWNWYPFTIGGFAKNTVLVPMTINKNMKEINLQHAVTDEFFWQDITSSAPEIYSFKSLNIGDFNNVYQKKTNLNKISRVIPSEFASSKMYGLISSVKEI